MDKVAAVADTYAGIMKKTRRRRKLFFATVLAYIPAIVITHAISPTDSAMGTVFATWVFLLIIVSFLAATCRCPGCGNYFHVNGMTFLVLRRCLHCQLHITAADPVSPETTCRPDKSSISKNI